MADNVVLNSGSGGATVLTDDCTTGHAQIVKLAIATDGSATLIPADGTAGLSVNVTDSASRDNGIVDIGAALPAGTNNIGDVDVLSVVPGTGATNLGKAIDTATGATDTGVLALVTRDDALGALTPVEGDNVALRVDANGALWTHDDVLEAALSGSELQVDIVGALPAGTNAIGKLAANSGVDIGDVDILSLPASTNTIEVVGDAAHDAAAAGNPLLMGAKAETAPSAVTAVTDGDATNLYAGADGFLYVRPYCALEDILSGVDTDTDGSSTAVIAAAGAGIRIYVTSVIVKNTHASTDAYIDLRDGAAGSVLATIPAPAAGGAVVNFAVPLRFTANTAVAVDPSAAVSTIITTVIGFKAAV